jgi:hypothetical protein
MAGIPIMSLFVLFDMVINNPYHPETSINLALLDIAGGHFSRIEYASGGSLPGSLIAEFAHIARDYVNGTRRNGGLTVGSSLTARNVVTSNSEAVQGTIQAQNMMGIGLVEEAIDFSSVSVLFFRLFCVSPWWVIRLGQAPPPFSISYQLRQNTQDNS